MKTIFISGVGLLMMTVAACGGEADVSTAAAPIPTDAYALDIDGDGVLDCVDLDHDDACGDGDMDPHELGDACSPGARSVDSDGDGCRDMVDLDCDGVGEILLKSACGKPSDTPPSQSNRPDDVPRGHGSDEPDAESDSESDTDTDTDSDSDSESP